MSKKICFFGILLFVFSSILISQIPQIGPEFGIETGRDATFVLGGAYDSEKYLVVMRKELSTGGAEIVGQFLSKADNSLIGSPIVLGTTVIPAGNFEVGIPQVAFDGNRFLVVWTDGENGGIKYRFIDAKTFQLSNLYSDSTLKCYLNGVSVLHFNSTVNKYFLVFAIRSSSGYYLAGTFILPNGYMENSFQVSNVLARKEYSLAYGNSKYLVCFIKETGDYDNEIWGQMVSENGSAIGASFLVDGSPAPSDNPLFVTFDGQKFISFFPDEETTGWKTYARFINQDGTVLPQRILITPNAYIVPCASVNGGEILFTATGFKQDFTSKIFARFFDLSLNPKGEEFVVFDTLGGKNPLGSYVVYGGGKYLVFTTRVRFGVAPDSGIYFTDGDVYGVAISPVTNVTSLGENPTQFRLEQNYPNPFNPSTTIRFSLPSQTYVTLKVFDILGREVTTLVDGELNLGEHSVVYNVEDLPSGVYYYRLQAGNFAQQKKMMIIK